MDEYRSTRRHKVQEAATISFGGGAISCTVRNLSDSGASLEVASPIGIPDIFALELEGGGRRCRAICRKEKRLGVRFTDLENNA
jgi:hypothetical protein